MRVALVDDHSLVRTGVREILEARNVEVVCDLGPSTEVLEIVGAHKPDTPVLDLSIPRRNGVELLKKWKTLHPAIPVLILSMHVEEPWVSWALEAGADGYISKSAEPPELMMALETVCGGRPYFGSQVRRVLKIGEEAGTKARALHLTQREKEVLQQVGRGSTLPELAKHFVVSHNTAKTHLHNLYRKFKVSDRAQLLLKARKLGLLDDDA